MTEDALNDMEQDNSDERTLKGIEAFSLCAALFASAIALMIYLYEKVDAIGEFIIASMIGTLFTIPIFYVAIRAFYLSIKFFGFGWKINENKIQATVMAFTVTHGILLSAYTSGVLFEDTVALSVEGKSQAE